MATVVLPLPFLPLPPLPNLAFAGLPSGLAFTVPGTQVNQPGVPSGSELLSQAVNSINVLASKAISNPLTLLTSPITTPVALANQMGQKLQAGTLQARNTNVLTGFSGAFAPLQPQPTLVVQGQLYNPNTAGSASGGVSGATVAWTTPFQGTNTPDPGSAIPVAPGTTFNFGSIDLGQIYVGNQSGNNQVPVILYIEQ